MIDELLYGAKDIMNYLRSRHNISLSQETFLVWRRTREMIYVKSGANKQSKIVTTKFLVDMWVTSLRLWPPAEVRSHSCFFRS